MCYKEWSSSGDDNLLRHYVQDSEGFIYEFLNVYAAQEFIQFLKDQKKRYESDKKEAKRKNQRFDEEEELEKMKKERIAKAKELNENFKSTNLPENEPDPSEEGPSSQSPGM